MHVYPSSMLHFLIVVTWRLAVLQSTHAFSFRAFDNLPAWNYVPVEHHHEDECEAWDWRKYALKLIKEIPVAGLFDDLQGNIKFEASGLTEYRGQYLMVFDSLHTIGVINERLQYRDPDNVLVGEAGEESQYEAITVRTKTDTILAVRETSLDNDQLPDIVEIRVSGQPFQHETVRSCKFNYTLPGENKGFEGAFYYDGGDRGEFLLGLCEGNYCEGNDQRGKDSGHGRVIVGKLNEDSDGCMWEYVKTVKLPSSANFIDYSDIAITKDGRVGLTSQENSTLWVGRIDWETFEFTDGVVLFFPRGAHCGMTYCNVEGIEWIDEFRVMVVTDRAKKKQPWQCSAKDQSVQVFALPKNKHLVSLSEM